jgi:hypothetical protein
MYKSTQGQEQSANGQPNAEQGQGTDSNAGGDNVTDAEFEEVK